MITHRLMPDGRVVAVDTRFEPLFGGSPVNTDPPELAGGSGLIQGLPDGSALVRPLAQLNNPGGVSDDAGPINEALEWQAGRGPVRLGPWAYSIASPITFSAGGQSLRGAGRLLTTVTQSSTTAAGMSNGTAAYTNLRVEGLTLTGPATGSGAGIDFTSPGTGLGGFRIRDVQTSYWGSHGLYINQPITSILEGIVSSHNGGDGFHIDTSTSLTSTSLIGCYALSNTANGYYLNLARYSALIGCAADTNSTGYYLNACQSVTLTGCGAESQTASQFYLAGGIGNAILGAWVGATASGANGINVAATEAKLTLKNCVENGPSGTASAFIRAATGSTGTLENCYNITANSIPAGWTTLA